MQTRSLYAWKRRLGFIVANAQSVRWQTQGRILARAVRERRGVTRRALDVGCGGGSYAIENLLRHGIATTLCDYSGELLELAKAQVAGAGVAGAAEFVQCSAEELPLPDASYDFIECMEVLEHLQHPERAVAEFRRVARPGARLVVSVPHPPEWFENPEHVVEGYTAPQLEALLAGAGWRVVRIEYCMLILSRLVLSALQLFRMPLPINPLAALENLIPATLRPRLLPYDIVAVAELPDASASRES